MCPRVDGGPGRSGTLFVAPASSLSGPRLAPGNTGSLLLSVPFALPAAAQTVEVQNGATLEVSNDAVLDLQGGQMALGAAGATARLEETAAGRVTGGTLTATRA